MGGPGVGFSQGSGMGVTTMRLLNNYGPRQSARAVIPTIISQALVRDDVHLGALEPVMDFNYVGDTVGAFLRVAETEETDGGILTWGSGRSTSIGDIADMVSPHRQGEPARGHRRGEGQAVPGAGRKPSG